MAPERQTYELKPPVQMDSARDGKPLDQNHVV